MTDRVTITRSEQMLRNFWERLDIDVRFECFIGLLALDGKVPRNLFPAQVIPVGSHLRNIKHDILPSPTWEPYDNERFFEIHPKGILKLYTSRSGILDYLPEDFYVEPDNYIEDREAFADELRKEDKEARRARIKAQLESARQFFQPLEIAFNVFRQEREQTEVEHLVNTDLLLATVWTEYPDAGEAWDRFRRTLHLAPELLGDLEATTALINYVLKRKVQLELKVEPTYKMTEQELQSMHGEALVLGFNMFLGNTVYDYQEVCMLCLQDLSTTDFFAFNEANTMESRLLTAIMDNYFPLNVDVRMRLTIAERKANSKEPPVLGYSTRLGTHM